MTLRGTFLWLLLVIMAAALPGAPGEGLGDRDANPTVRKSTSNNSDWSQDTKAGMRVHLTDSTCRGFVQLKHHGQWLPLCQESLDENTASVLCRMLDCGRAVSWRKAPDDGNGLATSSNATEIAIAASTAPNRTAAYFFWLRCVHPESALENCTVTPEPCHSERPAELNCTGVRLVGGPSRCAGQVEIEDPTSGSWGTVCDDSWDLSEGHVVCRQLECGSAVKTVGQAHFGKGDGPIHLDELNCSGSEPSLWDCPADRTTDCGHKEDAGVVCSVFLELMPTVSVTKDSSSTIASSSVKVTGFLDPRNDEVTSHQSQSLLLLCVFLALILLGTLLGCGLIVFRMRRKQRITSEEPRMPSLMRQGAPVLLSHSYQAPSLSTAMAVADTNVNQDTSLTLTPNPQVPAAGRSPAPRKDSDSDYEDYDFSSKPPKTLSSFYNSRRYRPIDERNPQNMAQMAMLQKIPGTEAPAVLTEVLREAPDAMPRQGCRTPEDTLSISSEEDYGISSSQMKNCSVTVAHQTNREAPPVPSKPSRAGTHLPSSGLPGLHQPDSCFVELEKDPELERTNARKSVVSRPTGSPALLKHYPQATDDSSSTSSGEEDWYQNWKPPPHTPQIMNARPFPGDSDASLCSREASSHWL